MKIRSYFYKDKVIDLRKKKLKKISLKVVYI